MPQIKVKLPIFSGRRNPTLIVRGARATELLKKIEKLNAAGLAEPADFAGLLGYDGFKVAHPQLGNLRVYSGLAGAGSQELEEELLSMFKRKLFANYGGNIARTIQRHVEQEIPLGVGRHILLPKDTGNNGFLKDHPFWQPGYWNGGHQGENNCYAYATNHRTDTFPQPGLGSGHEYGSIDSEAVLTAALSDGLVKLGDGTKFQVHVDKGWVVVLVIWKDVDYHWYRVDFDAPADRLCSHKPGGTAARQTDNSGKFITNPYEADRGGYTEVAATLVVPNYDALTIK